MFILRRLITRDRLRALVVLSVGGMFALTALEILVPPIEKFPHLYLTLNAIFCCGNLVVAYIFGVVWQWVEGNRERVVAVGGARIEEGKKKR